MTRGFCPAAAVSDQRGESLLRARPSHCDFVLRAHAARRMRHERKNLRCGAARQAVIYAERGIDWSADLQVADKTAVRCAPANGRFAVFIEPQYYPIMKFCVVTDIHDQPSQEQCFSTKIETSSGVVRLALNELCGRPNLSGEALHQHLFTHGGMDEAVSVLRQTLKGHFVGLGYSAGGTAVWRAAAAGFPFTAIFCVSSTRLRDEVSITIPNHVFFGAEDQRKPSYEWLSKIPDRSTVFDEVGHTYYLHSGSNAVCETRARILEDMQRLAIF